MSEESTPAKPGRQWWRVLLIVLALLLCIYAGYRYALHRQIEAKLDAIRREGYPVTLEEWNKQRPQPPTGENAADTYLAAFNLLSTDAQKYALVPIIGEAGLPARGEPLSDEACRATEQFIADNREALKLLHDAAAIRLCRYPSNVDLGTIVASSHVRGLLRAGKALKLEAAYYGDGEEPERAVDSLVASLRLARSTEREPLLVPHLLTIALKGMCAANLERLLNRTALADDQLSRIESAFIEADDVDALRRALISERCFANDMFKRLKQGRLTAKEMGFMQDDPGFSGRAAYWLFRQSGLLDLNHLCYLDFMSSYIETCKLPLPQRSRSIKSIRPRLEKIPNYRSFLPRLLAAGMDGASAADARQLAALRNAVTAVAVERYRLGNNRPPDRLEELVPIYLASVPVDPFDGGSTRYKKLAKGYIVYSVGPDAIDNGGAERNASGSIGSAGTDITFTVER